MKKSELKEIIKECLVEILAEGIGHDTINEAVSFRRSAPIDLPPRRKGRKNRQPTDLISFGQKPKTSITKDIAPQVEQVTSSLTSDPILAEIFKDTAMTTMQEQINADKKPNLAGGMSRPEIADGGVDVESMLPDNNWAQLAFMK
jgi:hypothetical protein